MTWTTIGPDRAGARPALVVAASNPDFAAAAMRAGADAILAEAAPDAIRGRVSLPVWLPGSVRPVRTSTGRPDIVALARDAARRRSAGEALWIAGSPEPPDIPRLNLLRPDALLLESVTDARIRAIRAALDARPGEGANETVFVRDLILRMRVGAYARERGDAQRVRFGIEATVTRASGEAHGIGDVFSYDVLADAARLVAAETHTGFVETVAERVAALVLAPPVLSVRVRVEKLDLGEDAGIAGVEIMRERER